MRSSIDSMIRRLRSLCLLIPIIAASASAADSLSDLTGPWQLFIDDFVVEAKSGLTRSYHAFSKYAGNPVLQADQAWEGTNVYLYGTVLPTEDHSGYRMWYHTLSTGQACYATSTDGIQWTKPALGIVSYNGSTANNMYTTLGSLVSVIHTPFNTDPNRRYTFFAYGSGGYVGAWSPDAIHWTGVPTNPLISGGDVGHGTWDPLLSRYLGYIKVTGYVGGLPRRSVAFSETTDFTTWPVPYLIMTPDAIDDRWVPAGTIQRTHFYGFCPFAYESQYIGFLWIYRATDLDGTYDGTIYVEVVSSRDGVQWTREEGDRPAILPLGPDGAWDDSMVFTSTQPLKEGGTLKLYYGGFDDTHVKQKNWHAKIGLATLRKDGFASLDAGSTEGTVTTKPLAGASGPLHVNCRATAGSLKVEVLDADGQVIPGYGRDDCTALQGDSTDGIVTWTGGQDLPASSGSIRLRFVLQNASLYSFDAGSAVRISAPPTITRQPVDRTILPGSSASFSVQAIAQAPVTYRWQKNGVDLADGGHYSGTGTSTLTVSLADCQDVASYRCVVTHSAGSAASAPAQLGLAAWTFTGIGMLTGTTDSTINGLSNDGTVAAGTSGGKPVIWSSAQGLKPLGLPPAATTSSAVGVGIYQGTVVVAVDTNRTTNRAYRWDGDITGTGSFTPLPKSDGYYEWTVRGLGTDGSSRLWITGSTLNGGAGNGRMACRYIHNQTVFYTEGMYPLPTGGHEHADFLAISDNGVSAGQYQYGGTAPNGGATNAMRYDGGSACIALNTLLGATNSTNRAIAKTISRNSLVLGGNSYYSGGGTLFQPVIWKNSTTPIAIPFIAGGDGDNDGQVLALNSDGTLAGGYSRHGTTGASEAFIWDAAQGTRSLQQVLASDFGLDLTGWSLQQVTAISSDGLALAGVGLHDGKTEGWVASANLSPAPPQVTRQPYPRVVPSGGTARFTIQATGAAAPSYQWQKEGANLADDGRVTGATTSTLTITQVSPADAGSYRCIVQAACESTVSNEATLTLGQLLGDLDGDGDVDGADLDILKGCLSGADIPVQAMPQCVNADIDHDGDADLSDFGLFQRCLTGSDMPPAPGCID